MALKDLIRPAPLPPTPAAERPPGITCEKYTRGEGKRCIHFRQGGKCALPDEFVCTEWQKHNGPNKRALPVVATPAVEAAPVVVEPPKPLPLARDLFGNPVALPGKPPRLRPVASASAAAPPRPVPGPVGDVDQPRGFTTEDIESFRALNVEVRLHSETYGELRLVPAYTDQSRKELSPEHLATIARVLEAFPGSEVLAFEKLAPRRPTNACGAHVQEAT